MSQDTQQNTQADLSGLSFAELQALLGAKRKEMEAEKDAARNLVQDQVAAITEAILTFQPVQPSEKDTVAWVGSSLAGLDVVVDGRAYSVQVSIKDVQATKDREPAVKIAKARALIAEANKTAGVVS